jgi:AcrR family transcriptional regulator
LAAVTAPQKTHPRRRHPPEVRRRLILEAARQCILARGLAATTVREIATLADVSIGTITYHFESVDEILAEVLRDSSQRFTERVMHEAFTLAGAMERLEFLIDTDLPDDEASTAQFRLWLEYWARAIHDPQLAVVHSERHSFERGVIEQIIAEGVTSGEFAPATDASAVAAEFLGLLEGLGLQVCLGDVQMPVETARGLLRNLLRLRLLPPPDA